MGKSERKAGDGVERETCEWWGIARDGQVMVERKDGQVMGKSKGYNSDYHITCHTSCPPCCLIIGEILARKSRCHILHANEPMQLVVRVHVRRDLSIQRCLPQAG